MKATLVTEKNIDNIYRKLVRFFGELPSEIEVYHTFGGGFRKNPKDTVIVNDGVTVHTRRSMQVAQITLQTRKLSRSYHKYRFIHIAHVDRDYDWAIHVGDRITFSSNRIIHQDNGPFYHGYDDPFNHGPIYMVFQK